MSGEGDAGLEAIEANGAGEQAAHLVLLIVDDMPRHAGLRLRFGRVAPTDMLRRRSAL